MIEIVDQSRTERDYAALVQHDRVHSSIFTDDAIYRDEIARIFHRTWLFALHESEIAKPGDFKLIELGRFSVIATRDESGEVRLLINRCRHRGAQVCEAQRGNTKRFQCWYHGWTYDAKGALVGHTGPEAYDDSFKPQEHALTPVARMASYRGFIFANLSPEGTSFEEYIGPVRQYIDIMIDASPTGEILVKPGVVNRTKYSGNWKQIGMDGYHPHYVHASVFKIMRSRKDTTGSAVGSLHVEDPFTDASSSMTRSFPFGHAMLDFTTQRRPQADSNIAHYNETEAGRQYVQDMVNAYGQQRADELIAWHGDPHLGVFPNLQLIHDHIRVVIPRGPNETEVHMYPVFLKGVGDSINEKRLRHHEAFYGPASQGSPDDAEVFERTQRGLHSDSDPWIYLGRGLNREQNDQDGSVSGRITDELTQRAQMQEWKRLMTAA
jgi:phenylpropionate dioxygenase-like ring-hydroxylating dioxygenase large terminal subunit